MGTVNPKTTTHTHTHTQKKQPEHNTKNGHQTTEEGKKKDLQKQTPNN